MSLNNEIFISKAEYQAIISYANEKHIKMSGFKKFRGDPSLITDVIDDICKVANDFPGLLSGRKSVHIVLMDLRDDDFATTEGHVIGLNSMFYSDRGYLQKQYQDAEQAGIFVRGTDYHSVVYHEMGHIAGNKYHFDGLAMAKDILNTRSKVRTREYVMEHLSLYADSNENGREIIAESFSAHYGKADNDFAEAIFKKCVEIVGGNRNDK